MLGLYNIATVYRNFARAIGFAGDDSQAVARTAPTLGPSFYAAAALNETSLLLILVAWTDYSGSSESLPCWIYRASKSRAYFEF